MSEAHQGALSGVRVLDLTRYVPGPYCTMLLGDLGADVVKVEEPPIGDPTRAVPPAVGEESVAHAALNRNKRSIVVDLRREDGAEIVRRLAGEADVLVEGFRPGALARRGLGAGTLRARNRRLVYCSLTGFGQDGPLAGRAGHDINYQARGGLLGATAEVGRPPVVPRAQVADMAGALVAAIGVLAALLARARTGEGQLVDVSILESVLALLTVPAARHLAEGAPWDELAGTHACYGVFRCGDGRYQSVGALEPKFWEALCEAVGLPEMRGRQWDDGRRRDEVRAAFADAFASRGRDEWLRKMDTIDACVEPVLDLADALGQAQVAARRAVVEEAIPGGRFRTLASPVRLERTPVATRRPAPAPGEHTEEVLREAGYGDEEIARLRGDGVVQ